jgi:glycosyltransferase involved in cell wall biosynthesis
MSIGKGLKVINAVTTDLVTDQRVHKISLSLHNMGFKVTLVGRRKKDSAVMDARVYATHRMRLWFEKGPFFYMNYTIRLFFYLLFHKADIIVSNDLDTLLPCYLISKIKRIPLVYDNHEYFTGVPELIERPNIQKIWKTIERNIFPKVRFIYTDNFAKKKLFENEYQKPVEVVMNVPVWENNTEVPVEYILPELKDKFVLMYQGTGINIKRGTEELTEAMQFLDRRFILVFIGSGDVINVLKDIVKQKQLEDRVLFVPKVPLQVLKYYTRQGTIGVTIDKPISENYIYSMPNKLFDYIHAGLPVLASHLQEVDRMIELYNVGTFIDQHEPKHIAERIQWIYDHPDLLKLWQDNTRLASQQVNWKTQEEMLEKIFSDVVSTIE